MRLRVMSDVHNEFGELRVDHVDCDAVILAGDIDLGVAGLAWALSNFDVPIFYLAGNHEYYRGDFDVVNGALEDMAETVGGYLLQDIAREIDDTLFVGGTLWTDFKFAGPQPTGMAHAERCMNDFRVITASGRRLHASDTVVEHNRTLAIIKKNVEKARKRGLKTVVVTHHAPSPSSCHPRYEGDPLNAAFASDLGLENDWGPDLWIHGHMHNSSDYMIGRTRVVCNPRGYYPDELNPDFDPNMVVEI